ncbi:MAG: nucleoside triphosphate pyrophosphohydrolase [Dehalococcoidia bacterium]|jgi:tetrapyrrole methylase family protein/MazG family protein|nr:nucleoside triphosphate pyrophosphohydrolase [Dehalococcoidia bacterium]MDW8009479.1 nucleoside triphosphate pyrophosphohydrolase [Chloroflexota bacterium]
MEISDDELRTFEGLRRVVAALRGPDGCPWDRAQTHLSLRHYLREEAAEALEAIEAEDSRRLAEELGDLLLQVLMHAQIAEEAGEFTLEDVIYGVAAKLVRRHPHVFGGQKLETPQQVLRQWDELKREERGQEASTLEGVPATLPALAQAQALQRRAARSGFTWPTHADAWRKLEEELQELRQAPQGDPKLHELGDALFALADLARLLELDAEDALLLACRRFRQRFQRLEALARQRGQPLQELAPEELLRLWRQAAAETP